MLGFPHCALSLSCGSRRTTRVGQWKVQMGGAHTTGSDVVSGASIVSLETSWTSKWTRNTSRSLSLVLRYEEDNSGRRSRPWRPITGSTVFVFPPGPWPAAPGVMARSEALGSMLPPWLLYVVTHDLVRHIQHLCHLMHSTVTL